MADEERLLCKRCGPQFIGELGGWSDRTPEDDPRTDTLARALYEHPYLREAFQNAGNSQPWSNVGNWHKDELRWIALSLLEATEGVTIAEQFPDAVDSQ